MLSRPPSAFTDGDAGDDGSYRDDFESDDIPAKTYAGSAAAAGNAWKAAAQHSSRLRAAEDGKIFIIVSCCFSARRDEFPKQGLVKVGGTTVI